MLLIRERTTNSFIILIVGLTTHLGINAGPHNSNHVCVCVLQIRCMLNIWGVMLFIRMSWIVGQAGIGQYKWIKFDFRRGVNQFSQ